MEMMWIGIGVCYAVSMAAFYFVSMKTAQPTIELVVLDGAVEETIRRAA
jgi:hypothetical protein